MLLLVVGLVVIVLVILVAVFLSVRSMRADEGDDYPARPAGAARAGRGAYADPHDRGSARRSDPRRQPAHPQPARGSGQPGRRSRYGTAEYGEGQYPTAEQDEAAYDQARFDQGPYEQAEYGEAGHERTRTMTAVDVGGPRGYRDRDRAAGERDLDRAPRRRTAVPAAEAGAAPQRRFGSLPRPRAHQHDQDAADAQPQDREDTRRVERQGSRLRAAGNGRDRSGGDWSASDWDGVSDEQYWAELSADKPLATTARSAQPGTDARPVASVRGDTAVSGRRARLDADSGQSRQQAPAGIPAAAAPTAKFSLRPEPEQPPAPIVPSGAGVPDTDPSIGGMTSWQDTAGHGAPTDPWTTAGQHAPGTEDVPTWTAEDPLTSPSFSAPAEYSVGAGAYQSAPPWESLSQDAGAPSYRDEYDGRTAGWTGTDYEYPSGALEPLPEAASSAAGPAGGWHTRTADAGQPEWQAAEPGYDAGSGHDRGHSADFPSSGYDDDHAGYGRRGLHSGDAGGGYESDGGYSGNGGYHSDSGYSGNGSYHSNGSYQSDSTYPGDSGYQLPGQGDHRDPGYDRPGYDVADAGRHQPGYDRDDPGHQARSGWTGSGHEQPGYGLSGTGYQAPGFESYSGYDGGRR